MHVNLLNLHNCDDSARYDRLFLASKRAFIQQSTWWARAIAPLGPDTPLFLIAEHDGEDVAGLPLYHFESPSGSVLTSVPQPGPLGGVFTRDCLREGIRSAAYDSLLAAAVELARERECLTLTVITNPLEDDSHLYEPALRPHYRLENYTQTLDLGSRPPLSESHRRSIRRANQANFTVDRTLDLAELCEWHELHCARSRETGAPPLSWPLVSGLMRELGHRGFATLITVRDAGHSLAAGGFYVRHSAVADMYMQALDGDYAALNPAFLATQDSFEWTREGGGAIYNWQSSPGRSSGVYRYKKQWGSEERPYWFLTRRLCTEQQLRSIGAEGMRAAFSGHFVAPLGLIDQPGERMFHKS